MNVSDHISPRNTASVAIARALAIGFGATAVMWVLSYVALLQPGGFVGEAIFVLTLLVLMAGGMVAAMAGAPPADVGRALRRGIEVGCISACINLLLIGSLVDAEGSSAAIWFIGLFGASILLGGIGGVVGAFLPRVDSSRINWVGVLAAVCTAITFMMIVSGGIVTGFEAGLAVPDWPNSYGHNMLLYPLSEMVEDLNSGIFYEHAHRLTGMFVGWVSIVLCIMLWCGDRRLGIGLLGTLILLLVIGQGVLGGLRVTGWFTLSDNPDLLSPSTAFGIVHGVLGQLILGCMVFAAALVSWSWLRGPAADASPAAGPARFVAWALMIALVIQLVIGAIYRHLTSDLEFESSRTNHILLAHIALAAIVALLAVVNGMRGLMASSHPVMRRIGLGLLVLVVLQLALGIVAMLLVLKHQPGEPVPPMEVVITSMHQANGALLLLTAVLMTAWTHRLTSAPASPGQSLAAA
ncbi:MAG: hypothetical protein CMJ24_12330 [Phycisphaerae bacterium]|nr:hypothetical protein [Phycisphaerae bacterium]